MRKTLWLMLFVLTLSPLAMAQPAEPISVSGEGYIGVIFLDSRPYEWDSGQVVPVWETTADDVAALEAALPAFLAGADHPRIDSITQRLAEYGRQYVGVEIDGEQRIFVNFFCDPAGFENWRTVPVVVEDGGACYFQVEFVPATGAFVRFTVNGRA